MICDLEAQGPHEPTRDERKRQLYSLDIMDSKPGEYMVCGHCSEIFLDDLDLSEVMENDYEGYSDDEISDASNCSCIVEHGHCLDCQYPEGDAE